MWTYYDRTGRMPGDCNSNGVIGYGLGTGASGTGLAFSNNPVPTADYCATSATSETDVNRAWSDMRVQRVLAYATPNVNLARHNFNDYFTIGNIASGVTNYNAIVIYGIPAWAAKMIDVSVDGAVSGTLGRVRNFTATITGSPWPGDAANDTVVSVIYFFDRIP